MKTTLLNYKTHDGYNVSFAVDLKDCDSKTLFRYFFDKDDEENAGILKHLVVLGKRIVKYEERRPLNIKDEAVWQYQKDAIIKKFLKEVNSFYKKYYPGSDFLFEISHKMKYRKGIVSVSVSTDFTDKTPKLYPVVVKTLEV
jgi:hypothetical protein